MRAIHIVFLLLQGLVLSFTVALVVGLASPLAAQETTKEATEDAVPTVAAFQAAQDAGLSADQLAILLVPLTVTELSQIADTWQGHLRKALDAIAQQNLALMNADDTQAAKLRAELTQQTKVYHGTIPLYQLVLANWGRKGGASEEIKLHRDFLNAVQAETVRTTDIQTLTRFALNWIFSVDGGLGLLSKLVGFLFAVWAMMFVARFVRKVAGRTLERIPNLSNLLKSFALTAVYWSTFVVGILVVLALFGVNVTPLFAVVGGLSFILGFALQETLGNLASGLMIMVLKPFDMGDYIQTAGTSGVVDDMSVVSTQIRTFDNQIIVVPNSKIWGDVITNVSASATRRVDLVFGIGYGDSADHAIRILQDLVANHALCLGDPAPAIFVGELGDSSVNIFCRPWSKSQDYWTVYWDLLAQAKDRFDAEGISIPFPQRDVHLIQDDPAPTTG